MISSKTLMIIGLILAVIFVSAQVYIVTASNNIEKHKYSVEKDYGVFEVRKYEAAAFTTVTMASTSYDDASSKGFRTLAGYIFGGNDENQSIAMTSPVAMTMGDSIEMAFMVPSKYEISDLPEPDNKRIEIVEKPGKYMAAVAFGGWASDARIESNINRLKGYLNKAGIKWVGEFTYLGYNPPYQLINRHNEIVVEVDTSSLKKL